MNVSPEGRLITRSPGFVARQEAVVHLGRAEPEVERAAVSGGKGHLQRFGAAEGLLEDAAAPGDLPVVGGQCAVLHALLDARHRGGAEVLLQVGERVEGGGGRELGEEDREGAVEKGIHEDDLVPAHLALDRKLGVVGPGGRVGEDGVGRETAAAAERGERAVPLERHGAPLLPRRGVLAGGARHVAGDGDHLVGLGVEDVREQLDEIERHVASALP